MNVLFLQPTAVELFRLRKTKVIIYFEFQIFVSESLPLVVLGQCKVDMLRGVFRLKHFFVAFDDSFFVGCW